MIHVEFEGIAELRAAVDGVEKKLKGGLAKAVNATSKRVVTEVVREIRKELRYPAASLKKKLAPKRATAEKLHTQIIIEKEKRLTLKNFKPKQNRRGVGYSMDARKGRGFIPGAFMGPTPTSMFTDSRFRGQVFKRIGKNRKPLVLVRGASPWGAFVKRKKMAVVERFAQMEMRKQMQRVIREITLRREGVIQSRQSTQRG